MFWFYNRGLSPYHGDIIIIAFFRLKLELNPSNCTHAKQIIRHKKKKNGTSYFLPLYWSVPASEVTQDLAAVPQQAELGYQTDSHHHPLLTCCV